MASPYTQGKDADSAGVGDTVFLGGAAGIQIVADKALVKENFPFSMVIHG